MKSTNKKTAESISNFIEKTYSILENQDISHIAAWTPRGTSFIIKEVKRFEEDHSNFSSFVRQLNMYDFHKVRGDRLDCQFQHDQFRRGCRDLLSRIKRKQSESFIISQQAIEENVGQPLPDSCENIKIEGNINSDRDLKAVNIEKPELSEELQILKKQNKQLRALKQQRQQQQKLLSAPSKSLIGQKFFKLTTCMLAQKLQKSLNIQTLPIPQKYQNNNRQWTFDDIMQHILDNSQNALQFLKYQQTAKMVSQKQTEFDFMIRKANHVSNGEVNFKNVGASQLQS